LEIGIVLLAIVAGLIGVAFWVHHSEKRQQGGQSRPVKETSKTSDKSAHAVIAELRSALAMREETIKDLREKGKRVVADRDRWERAAKRLQVEIAASRTGAATAGSSPGNGADKFRELKVALAKMLHPDSLSSASNFERIVREELFKEINVEIDRIEGRRDQA
jgi:hypothetical protein